MESVGDGTNGIGCIMELGEGPLGSWWFIIGLGDIELPMGEDGFSEEGAGDDPSRSPGNADAPPAWPPFACFLYLDLQF